MLFVNPTQLESPKYLGTNFVVWLDFSERSRVLLLAEKFATIEDLSPNGVDFQAPTVGQRPLGSTANRINGRNASGYQDTQTLRSDTDDASHDVGSGDFTMIVVCESDDDERAASINRGATPHYQMRFNNADADDGDYVVSVRNNVPDAIVTIVDTTITHNNDVARAYMMMRDGANIRLFWNNTESSASPAAVSGSLDDAAGTVYLWIGSRNDATQYFWGRIGEVLIWKRKLTSDELAMVHRYLTRKWGL